MAFKQRSSGPFKMMGSSPVKQIDPLDLGLLDEAKQVKVNKGLPKNFNTKGSSASTTPGYKDTKAAKHKTNKSIKAFKNTPKQYVETAKNILPRKAVRSGIAKGILRGAGQVASKFAGPVGAILTGLEVGSWAYKNRKSISDNAQTTLQNRAKRSTKGFDPFTPKN